MNTGFDQQLIDLVFQGSRDAIGVSERGVHVLVNPAYLQLFGYDRQDELVGKPILPLIAEGERARITSYVESRAAGTFDAAAYDTRGRRRDGTEFDMEVYVAVQPREGHQFTVVTLRDITARRRMEQALRQSEEKFRLICEQSLLGIAILQDDRVAYANQAVASLNGYRIEELMGFSPIDFSKLVHPDDVAFVSEQARRKQAGESDTVTHYGYRILTKSGAPKWVEQYSTSIHYGTGTADLVMLVDASERKRAEEDRAELDSALLRVQKMEAIGHLAAGLAHDFNNLLSAILGNVSLARTTTHDPFVGELLLEAEQASLRARAITGQLLTFSKGGAPITKVVALGGLVREAVDFALRGTNVVVSYDVAEGLPNVAVDPGQIGQLLHNLVCNAAQAMPDGGTVTVRVDAVEVGAGGEDFGLPLGKCVRLRVEDEGPGIPEALRDQIFYPYFSTKMGSTGLGLAVSYSIVRRHGGHIGVASTASGGALFTVHLPASHEATAEVERKRSGSLKQGVRVLGMDDEPSILRMLESMTGRLGATLTATKDGAQAVEAYAQAMRDGQPFDAVLLDLTVPGKMGGRDAIAELRAMDPNVVAIVSSGYSDDPVMANYRAFGFRGILQKPYGLSDLEAALSLALAGAPC